jgi:hypothetical protein
MKCSIIFQNVLGACFSSGKNTLKHLTYFSVKLSSEEIDDGLKDLVKKLIVSSPKLKIFRFLLGGFDDIKKLSDLDLKRFLKHFPEIKFNSVTFQQIVFP